MPLPLLVFLWVPMLALLYGVRIHRNTPGAGLFSAYLLGFAGLHWVGGLIRLFPWFPVDIELTRLGLGQATVGLAGFIVGSLLLAPMVTDWFPKSKGVRYEVSPHLATVCAVLGVISFFLKTSFIGRIPSVAAIVSIGQALYVVGACLYCWYGFRQKRPQLIFLGFGMAVVLPIVTVVSWGFLGFGISAAMVVFAFATSFTSRTKTGIAALLLAYFGLSMYTTYMRDRTEIRALVWGGQSLEDRTDRVVQSVKNFEWFDPRNFSHLRRIENRMNQNWLVGTAIERISTTHDFAEGSTLWDAVLSLIPRVLWPDKTVFAGSGDLVSRFTGLRFTWTTSVGIGQVMEFYVNFGTLGVLLGFVVIGAAVTTIDTMAAIRLAENNQLSFIKWALLGLAVAQSGGSLVETTGGAASSLVLVVLLNRTVLRGMQKKVRMPAVAPPQAVPVPQLQV